MELREKLIKRGVVFQILTATPHAENETNENEKKWDMSECSYIPKSTDMHLLSTLAAIGSATVTMKKEKQDKGE